MRKLSLLIFAWNIRENRIGHSRGTPHAHASCQDYFSSHRNISCMSAVPHKVEKVRLQFKFVHAFAMIHLGGSKRATGLNNEGFCPEKSLDIVIADQSQNFITTDCADDQKHKTMHKTMHK